MKRFMILITAIAAAYLSMPWAAVAQDFSKDTLWTRDLTPESSYASRFSPDGKYVIAAVGKTICKFDALTGNLVSRFKDTCDDVIIYMNISKKFSKILTISQTQHHLYIWDYNLEKIIKIIDYSIEPHTGTNVAAISNDERYGLVGRMDEMDSNLIILNLENYSENILSIKGKIKVIAFSPDGKYFVTASHLYDSFYQEIYSHLYLWKTENWEFVQELGYVKGKIINLNYSPDGKYLACAIEGPPLIVWDMLSRQKIKEYNPPDTPWYYRRGAFSKESKYILFSFYDFSSTPRTFVFDFEKDSLVYQYNVLSTKGLEMSNDDEYVLCASVNDINVMKPTWLSTGIETLVQKPLNSLSIIYSKDSLHFNVNINNPGLTNISIFDINGNKMQTFTFKYLAPGHYNFARASSLPTGIYFAVMQCGDNTISQQFEVVR